MSLIIQLLTEINSNNFRIMQSQPPPPPPPPVSQITPHFQNFSILPLVIDIDECVRKTNNLLSQEDNWKSLHEGLDNLRIINKTFPSQAPLMIQIYGDVIINNLNSQKLELSKNALALIQEIFMAPSIAEVPEQLVSAIFNALLQIPHKQLKLQFKDCLISLASNYANQIVIRLGYCLIQQFNETQLGIIVIAKSLQKLSTQNNLQILQVDVMQQLYYTVYSLTQQENSELKDQGLQIASFLIQTQGEQFFLSVVNSFFSLKEQELFINILDIQLYNNQNSVKPSHPLQDTTNLQQQFSSPTHHQKFQN